MQIMKNTDKKCKRCNGRGIGQWGSIYGECYRCGGDGIQRILDVPATLAAYEIQLAKLKSEGEKHKTFLEVGIGGVLDLGHARRELAYCRRTWLSISNEHKNLIVRQEGK